MSQDLNTCTFTSAGGCAGEVWVRFGCDGVLNSGLIVDACSVCGGDNSTCADFTLGVHGCPDGATMIGWFSGEWVFPSVRTYGFPHDTVSGLIVFDGGVTGVAQRFVGYQLNSVTLTSEFVDAGYYGTAPTVDKNTISGLWNGMPNRRVLETQYRAIFTRCEFTCDHTIAGDTIAPLGAKFKGWMHGDMGHQGGYGLNDHAKNTYAYEHETINGLYIFAVGPWAALKLVGYQFDPTTATFARVDGRHWQINEPKYCHTFVATGCCNENPYSWLWPTATPSAVFTDMKTHCDQAKAGNAGSIALCGCGDVGPLMCELQSAFTVDRPSFPVDRTTVSRLWDSPVPGNPGTQRTTGVSDQGYRVNQIVECKLQDTSCDGVGGAFSLANFNGNWGPASEHTVVATSGTFLAAQHCLCLPFHVSVVSVRCSW